MFNRFLTRPKLALVLCALSLGGLCECTMHAAVQEFTFFEQPDLADYSKREVEVPQFNPSLGGLESITIELQATGGFLDSFNQLFGGHRELSKQQHFTLVLETSNNEKLISLSQLVGQPSRGAKAGSSPGSRVEPFKIAGEALLTSESDLRPFTGCGMVDLFLSAHDDRDHYLTGEHAFLNALWTAGANIKVIYNYSAIPEPSRWWLGDCVLAGLAFGATGFYARKARWNHQE
jgi:hypothetical protein